MDLIKLSSYIQEVNDFPKPGVSFKDFSPLLHHPEAREFAIQELVNTAADKKIDVVVGIESRGFLFGILLAQRLNCKFVMVRKPGKLPGQVEKMPYELEYGYDSLEIQEDAITAGDRVLVHDDVLATGGTARATCKLIEAVGGEVTFINFLMELPDLNGARKLQGREFVSLLKA